MANSEFESNDSNVEKEYTYNLTELIQLSNGNNDFLANMIGIFIRSSSEIILKMKNALTVNDWEEASSLAHKAIPSFHFMGLNNFSEKLRFIENNASNEKEHKRIYELVGFIDKNLSLILNESEKEPKKYKK